MKKKISAVIILAALLAGCTTDADEPAQPDIITESETLSEVTTAAETEAAAETTAAAETDAPVQAEKTETIAESAAPVQAEETENTAESAAPVSSVSEDELRTLMEENLFCMRHVFTLGTLPHGDVPIQGESVYKVEDDRFQTFTDLEEYVRSVYCTETADMYLYNYPYEGEPLYFDADGQLCIDIYRSGEKGYYVDWTDFGLAIIYADDTVCEFTVTGLAEEPAAEPTYTEYTVNAKAVCENGRWVLEKMIC